MTTGLRTRRWPIVATAYSAVLLGGYCWWMLQTPQQRTAVLVASSTNLAHLEHAPWLVLPASSLWSGAPIGYWLTVSLLCLGALELIRGPLRTLLTGALAHVIGTLVSEGVLAVRIAAGEVSSSARRLLDFGPSYIVAACAAAVVTSSRAPRPLRVVCALTLVPLAIEAFDVTDASQVATIGHAVAIIVGAWMGLRPMRSGQSLTAAVA
ncbi:MAG: hypothetical protein QOF18_2573 [Frankiaceae bacterium]|jgi:hypothetical protein|nr:hypothetical protein [Frankiaceae bacterium]